MADASGELSQSIEKWNPHEVWRRFRLELEAARGYPVAYMVHGAGVAPRHPVLEAILPALLYLNAVAILDDGLELWLDANGHRPLRSSYRDDLHGRLKYLDDNEILEYTPRLREIKDMRNKIAHRDAYVCDWKILLEDISAIEKYLIGLGLALPTKKLEYFAEKSAAQASDDPRVAFCSKISYGVKEDGKPALVVTTTENVHKLSSS